MNICVHPDFQGKGLGRALLKEYLARSKANKAEAWFLEVRAGNSTAISLYEARGLPSTAGAPTTMAPARIGKMPC